MLSRCLFLSTLSVVALTVGGCASAKGRPAAIGPSVTEQAATGALGPAMLQWTGRFRAVQQQLGDVEARARNNASGTVVLTAPNDQLTRVQMNVSGPEELNGQLRWEVAPGACRSGTIPLMPVNQFPEIRMSNGHGALDQTISMPLPTSGSYHVNIHTGDGADESDVLTCAELKLERRS